MNYKPIRTSRSGKKVSGRWLVILFIVVLAIGLPMKFVFDGIMEVKAHGKGLATAYSAQNFGLLQNEVGLVRGGLEKVDTSLDFLFWAKFIPLIGGYIQDIDSLASASVDVLRAFDNVLLNLKPYEEELGFSGQPIAGQDRVTQALAILEKAILPLNKEESKFQKAKEKVEGIDVEKYPEEFRGIKLRSIVQTSKNFILGLSTISTTSKDILELTPSALGKPSSKTYLLLFQNDKEIRPTGGFITAFAFLKIDKGQITTTTSDDIYRLDERLLGTCQSKICPLSPPAPIVKYLPEVDGKPRKAWSMRDSNISPDVPTSAKEFERMYTLLGEGTPFDGIIYIDSQVVEELIEVTGEVDIFGTSYSAKVDHRCKCPNVIFELESYAEIAGKGEQDRKAILGVLMSQILAKLVGTETEKIPQAIETVVRLANHKHILFYMHDEETQKAFAKLNWIGEIKQFDGDFLHINDSNFAGGKSNLYVEQRVLQDIKIKDGKVSKKITIEYKNPEPFGVWLNGINRDWVRFYVPIGSKLISGKGSEDGVRQIKDELEKSVFEAFVTVRPQNSRKLEIEYEVPYSPKGEYKLMIQKQPGAKDFEYEVKINGSKKTEFKLDSDKEFKFGI